MKKFLSWMLIASMALVAVSCEESDDVEPVGSGNYVGTLSFGSTTIATDMEVATKVGESTISVTLKGVSFATGMPSMDINFDNIPMVSTNDYEIVSLIPTVQDIEMPTYTMTDVSVKLDGNEIEVEFTRAGYGEMEYKGTK